jgi:hypothetical protein
VLFTLIVVHPTYTRLLQLHAQGQIGHAPALLDRWSGLHAVRSVLGVAAFVLMLAALGRG